MLNRKILDNKEELSNLYDGHTTGEIGEMIGIHNEYVRLALHRHNIPVRGKGARTSQDRIDRAINKIKNILFEYPAPERRKIIEGFSK